MKYCNKCHTLFEYGTDKCTICGGPLVDRDLESSAKTHMIELTMQQKIYRVLVCIVACCVLSAVSAVFFRSDGIILRGIVSLLTLYFMYLTCKYIWYYKRAISIDYDPKYDEYNYASYFYTKGSEIIGPCTGQQIKDLNLEDDVLIMNKKDNKWVKYREIKDSFNYNIY